MDRRLTVIFCVLFVLFFTGTRFNLDGYETEYVLSAMSLYHGNGPALATGFERCPGIPDTTSGRPVFPRQNLLQSYLSVPFYALGALLFGEAPTIPDRGGFWQLPWGPMTTVAMLNPLLAALIAVFIALIARDLGIESPGHYQLAVLFSVTTMIWHYAGLGMEIVQTAVLTGTVWSALRFRFGGGIRWFITTLLFLAALPSCKKHSFIFVLPLVIYVIWSVYQRSHKHGIRLAVGAAVAGILGVSVMLYSAVMRFQADPGLFPNLLRTYTSGGFKSIDLLFGLTVSPGEGLLVFNPMLLFAIPAWRDFYRSFKAEALLFMGLTALLLLALWRVPYVLIDEEWGTRYLLCVLPLFFLAGARGLLRRRRGFKKYAFITILVISILFNWISSMYLGYKLLDATLGMGHCDYMVTVFMPSQSHIPIMITCFVSHIYALCTGKHLILKHREYNTYTGRGGSYQLLRRNLEAYDYPAGGVFTVRWVLSEMGKHPLSQGGVFILRLLMDSVLLAMLGWFTLKRSAERRITGLDSAH